MTAMSACSDASLFLRAWMRDPLKIASVVPSGRSLSSLITQEIGPGTGRVIELGPGTGVFTRALLERGVRPADLILVEQEGAFSSMLAERFEGATVLIMDAGRLGRSDLGPVRAGAAISGLPLLSMPVRKMVAILRGVFSQMAPGGRLYQFTYSPRCPIPRPVLDRLGLKAVLVGRTVRNFPPASVYRITMRRHTALRSGGRAAW